MAASTIATNGEAWREVSTTAYWTARSLWDTGTALYAVVQDTGATPRLRVFKANSRTNPTSWTEQNSAGAPLVNTGRLPFSSWLFGSILHTVYFSTSGITTLVHRTFNTTTDTWSGSSTTPTTGAFSERPIRIVVRSDGDVLVAFSSSADDADLGYVSHNGTAWGDDPADGVTALLGVASAEASSLLDMGIDSTDRVWAFWYNCAADLLQFRTINAAGTIGNLNAGSTGSPATETGYNAGARYNLYDDAGTDKVIVAHLSVTPTLIEQTATLEADSSGSTLATVATIEGTAADVGVRTPASTAVIGGVPYAAWWDDVTSGTIKYATKSGGAWGAETNFATSITRLVEIVPAGGNGLAVVYQSGSNLMFDWIVAPSTAIQKSDTDSLAVTADETDVVAAALPETESLAVTLSETDAIAAALPETDSLAITLTESETVLRQMFRTDTDSLDVTLSESETIQRFMFRVDTDAIDVALNEAESVSAALPESDSLAVSIVESEGVFAALATETDALGLAFAELDAVVAAVPESDTVSVPLSELDTVSAALPETDALDVAITDVETVVAMIYDTDAIALGADEEIVTPTPVDSDALSVELSEVDVVTAALAETDTLAVTLSESESVEKQAGIVQKSDTDSLAIELSETDSVAVPILESDSLGLNFAELDGVAASLPETDVLDVPLDEAEYVLGAIPETDSLDITLSESEVVARVVFISDTDTLAVTLTENEDVSLYLQKTDSDALNIELTETSAVHKYIFETDTLAIELTEADALSAGVTDNDILDVAIVEVDGVLVSLFEVDTLALVLVEVSNVGGAVSLPPPLVGVWQDGEIGPRALHWRGEDETPRATWDEVSSPSVGS